MAEIARGKRAEPASGDQLGNVMRQVEAVIGDREETTAPAQPGEEASRSLLDIARERPVRSRSRRRRNEREKRRRRRRSSSGSRSSSPFRDARRAGSAGRSSKLTAQPPGKLLRDMVSKIKEFMVGHQGGNQSKRDQVAALFTPYLTSILLPSLSEKPSLRNSRELLTIAQALDALVEGDLERVGDLLSSRFKALETATQEGNWNLARHYELIGDSKVTTASKEEREAAMREEARDLKYQQMAKQ